MSIRTPTVLILPFYHTHRPGQDSSICPCEALETRSSSLIPVLGRK